MSVNLRSDRVVLQSLEEKFKASRTTLTAGLVVQLRLTGVSGWTSEQALAWEGSVAPRHVSTPCHVGIFGAGHTRA